MDRMARYSGEVCPCEQSQAVLVDEKDPTEVEKRDMVRGFKAVNLRQTEGKVIIPGMKNREDQEKE